MNFRFQRFFNCFASIVLALSALTASAQEMIEDQQTLEPQVVVFRIANGTGKLSWNTPEQPVMAKVGDTIRFVNEDTIVHQLHTNGRPCEHGPAIMPGGTWDCIARTTYNYNQNGALYDHNFGMNATFWMIVE